MDTTTLFVTIGGWLVTLAVCFIETRSSRKKFDEEQAKHLTEINHAQDKHAIELKGSFEKAIAVIDTKIDELSKRVEKHNNVVERTFKLEADMALVDEKIKVANHRIRDIEGGKKE